ncbi:MAG: hypothetical protein FJW30_02645 [Acidobacteria bacterium]|nr:hypothetical protein [Acidobacteriota bacterium]
MRTLGCLLMLCLPAWAETAWARLAALDYSHRTTVQTMDGKKHRGDFVFADADEIVIRAKDMDEVFKKDEVMEVRTGRGRRTRAGLRSGVVLGALPVAIGIAAGGPLVGLRYAGALGGYGGVMGAVNSRGERIVYRARRR